MNLPAPEFHFLDCREFLRGLDGTADLVVTSPPYVGARTGEAYGTGDQWSWTAKDNDELGEALFAALRPGGTALVNVNVPIEEYRRGHRSERPLEVYFWIIHLVEAVGFTFRDDIIYKRTGAVGAYGGRFRTDWEHILWLERPGGDPTFDKSVMDTPAVGGAYAGTAAKGTRGKSGKMINKRIVSGDAAERGVVRRGNVWDYGNIGNGNNATPEMEAAGHPAAFCLQFALDAVGCFSKPGDLVVDPFHGRGTVAVACRRLGRRFKGSDIGHDSQGRRWNQVARDLTRMDY